MDEKILAGLRERMDNSLLKDIRLNGERRKSILNHIELSEQRKEKKYLQDLFPRLLTVGLIIVIALFGVNKVQELLGEESIPKQASKGKFENNPNEESTIFSPNPQKESFEEMSKEQVLIKLLNTVDYFETAKGEFEVFSLYKDGSSDRYVVNYDLINKAKPAGFESVSINNSKTREQYFYYFNAGSIWHLDDNKKSFTQERYLEPESYGTPVTINKNNEGVIRERPPVYLSGSSLYPYEIASNYTMDLNKWDIEKQNEIVLGHNSIVLKGMLGDYAKDKHSSSTFRFWVDKDTGILIKYETYNDNEELVNYLHPKKLEINVPIDRKKLEPNLIGYKEYKR